MKRISFGIVLGSILGMSFTEAVAQQSTQVVAHRGAWKEFNLPENSLAALVQAAKIKCHGIEFDIHLSKDDSIMVFHDNKLNEQYLTETSYLELQQHKLKNGESIPTFSQYLNAYLPIKGPHLFVELKHSNLDTERKKVFVEKVMKEVENYALDSLVTYISFDLEICSLIKKMKQNATVQFLNSKHNDIDPQKVSAAGFDGIDYHYKQLQAHPEWLPSAKALGLERNTWTVNDTDNWDYFLKENIEYITTDYPQQLLDYIKK